MKEQISLSHGDGGKYTSILINELFYKYFGNEILLKGGDSAVFSIKSRRKLAFSTDSFVVKPLFFPGGDIGKLAVCGTINDLSVSGAKPLYLSAGFIIEEGFSISDLKDIVRSMGQICKETGTMIIAGDTKVVEKGDMDGLCINTAGIGVVENGYMPKKIKNGDRIIITGSIAEHGTAIVLERYKIKALGAFVSDCAPVYNMISSLAPFYKGIKLMRDPTRGGVATALNEISASAGKGIRIYENALPIRNEVNAVCSILGLDPLYLASEGRVILVADPDMSQEILECIRSCKDGENSSIIGSFFDNSSSLVYMETEAGGRRLLNTLEFPMLPRIC